MDDLSRHAKRPFLFYLRYVRLRPVLHAGILLTGFAARYLRGGNAIRDQVPGRYAVGQLPHGNPWLPFAVMIALLSRRSSALTPQRCRGQHDLPAGGRRSAKRPLPLSGWHTAPRYFADRLPGTLSQPDRGDWQCRHQHGEPVLLERPAAHRRQYRRRCGSRPRSACRSPLGLMLVALAMVLAIYRLAAAARPLSSQLCRKGCGGRWRAGRHHRQYGHRSRLRRHSPRDGACGNCPRPRGAGTPAQPSLYGPAARAAFDHGRDHDGGIARLGDHAVAAKARPPPAMWFSFAPSDFRSFRRPASWPMPSST